MAFGRQQPDPRPLALQQGVGRNRGAVDDAFGRGQQCRAVDAERLRQPGEPVEHSLRWVIRGGGHLFQNRATGVVDRDEIGKGASDIDPDAIHDDARPSARR